MNSQHCSESKVDVAFILSQNLGDLLRKKNLKENIFEKDANQIIFNDDIAEHVAWAYNHIYSVPYPKKVAHKGIARFYHGITHVSRAATYVLPLANLYRRYGDKEALQLSKEQLKLIQIAVLFHDSAREDEEIDLWDHESAVLLYHYLTRILRVSPSIAKELAEAVANKDWSPGKEYYILHEVNGEVIWSLEKNRTKPRSIYHSLIHDADCLDIIRARDAFDGKHLDFYKEIAHLLHQTKALDEIGELILEARSLIEIEGDARRRTKPEIKIHYENAMVYTHILRDIYNGNYSLLATLYANGQLLPIDKLVTLSLIDENNILNNQRIFARGIITPSALARRHLKKRKREFISNTRETLAELEFRKVKRRKGILTNTSKLDGLTKEGNPNRSVSLLGHGGSVFADAGGLIFAPDASAISSISISDSDTGWGKKKSPYSDSSYPYFFATNRSSFYLQDEYLADASSTATSLTLEELERNLKLGGSARIFKNGMPSTHTEIIYHVKHYDGIYYTLDPTFANECFHGSSENTAPYSPILKAIFLQYEYSHALGGEQLPIYEYSGIHNYLKKMPSFTDEQIINMWVTMCSCYIKKAIKAARIDEMMKWDINGIQIASMYERVSSNGIYRKMREASSNYPEHLKVAVTNAIEKERQRIIVEEEQGVLQSVYQDNGVNSLVSDDNFKIISNSSKLLSILKPMIENQLSRCMLKMSSDLFVKNEICQELIRFCLLAKNAGVDVTDKQQAIKNFILHSLSIIPLNNSYYQKILLNNITRLACWLDILSELKPILSKYNCYQWMKYKIDIDDERKAGDLYLSDLITALKALCAQNGAIDLTYLNVLEISKGSSTYILFLNRQYLDWSIHEFIESFFKPELTQPLKQPINQNVFFPPAKVFEFQEATQTTSRRNYFC